MAGFQYLDAFALWTQISSKFTIVMFLALTFPLFLSIYIHLFIIPFFFFFNLVQEHMRKLHEL